MLPLVPLYWVGLRVAASLRGRPKRLGWPVVSVGSLSAGGAGKTPVVLMLAELLGRYGVEVDVLSRGYGRKASYAKGMVEEVDGGGSAGRFGDEPVEMARAGVKVWVGADRWAAGRLAEDGQPQGLSTEVAEEVPRRSRRGAVHLLDDGFQHRRLGRDLDVMLLTLADAEDCLLPGGNLREPLSALRRADVVVVREEEAAELVGVVAAKTSSGKTRAEVWVVRRELVLPAEVPKRPVVFCGIARPEGFLGMLREAGVEAAGTVVKADHYAYSAEDVGMLVGAARVVGADGFITTGKDAVKISEEWRARLEEVGPVVVAGLQVRLLDEERAMRTLEWACGWEQDEE